MAHAEQLEVYGDSGPDPENLQRALDVHIDASAAEQERGANLNTRAATVAAVTGIVVALTSAIAKPLFETKQWTDVTKIISLALFVAALFLVATAMGMVVWGVLRPKRGTTAKNFLSETLIYLADRDPTKVVNADKDRLNLVFLHCCMRTLPAWHLRNRRKAVWLRRSWVLLGTGTILLASLAVLVLAREAEIITPKEGGPAEDLTWWQPLAYIALLSVSTWIVVKADLLRARTPEDQRAHLDTDSIRDDQINSERARAQEIDNIVAQLCDPLRAASRTGDDDQDVTTGRLGALEDLADRLEAKIDVLLRARRPSQADGPAGEAPTPNPPRSDKPVADP